MLRRITYAAILVAAVALAASFAWAGVWPLGAAAVAAGAAWAYAYRRHWQGTPSFMLVAFVVLAAVDVNLPGGRLLAPLAVVSALAAWDLHRFTARLRGGYEHVEEEELAAGSEEAETVIETSAEDLLLEQERRELEKQHLRRLLAVSGAGLALAWVAEAVRLRLALPFALALGVLAILGLSQVVRSLVRESD